MATKSNLIGLSDIPDALLLDMEHNHRLYLECIISPSRTFENKSWLNRKVSTLRANLGEILKEAHRRGLKTSETAEDNN